MKNLDFIMLVFVLVLSALPLCYLGCQYVVANNNIVLGVYLLLLGAALPIVLAVIIYKYK